MKLLLINPPKEREFTLFVLDDYNTKARTNQPPLGLFYLYSYLSTKHKVSIVDMNAEEKSVVDIDAILEKEKPDLVGITCVISKWLAVRDLAHRIKNYDRNIRVVLGGANPTRYPLETLQCEDVDYVIRGFGQVPLMCLCDGLENVENCFTRKSTNVKVSTRVFDIDDFPLPDRGVLPIDYYNVPYFPENPSTSMITSLGCPYSCAFCACKNFKPVYIRNAEKIIREMAQIQVLGIRSILFQDELFTMSFRRINDICSLIQQEGISLNWSVRSRVDRIRRDSLEVMKNAGCFNIHLGIESGNNRILAKMKKGITVEQAREAVKLVKSVGLSCSASFMIGYLSETREEILTTIDFAANLDLDNCQFYITQPEPNTELYNEVGLECDLYSQYTLRPNEVDLRDNLASVEFKRGDLIEFVKLAYSKTNNLYRIRGNQCL